MCHDLGLNNVYCYNHTFTPAENHKAFYLKAYKLLNTKDVVDLPDKTNSEKINQYYILNQLYEQIHGKMKSTKHFAHLEKDCL